MSQYVQIVNYPALYASGCQVSYSTTTTLSISAGQVRDSTNVFDIIIPSALPVSIAFTGANGLDTGTVAADTWYAVYVIYDNTGNNPIASLLSTSATAPVMPSVNGVTYSAFRLVGYMLTNGSSNFINSPIIVGNSNSRIHVWNNGITVLNAGAASTATNVSCALAVPSINHTLITFDASFTPAAAGNTVHLRPFGSSATAEVGLSGSVAAVAQLGQFQLLSALNSEDPTVIYINSAASCSTTLRVRSFQYFI